MTYRDVIKKTQDLTSLAWDEKTVTSGTGGTFLKSRRKTSRGNVYYKLSCYDRYRGIYGHESVNELIASRLLESFDLPHIPYRLIHANVLVDGKMHETWVSESRDYRQPNERRQALDTFIELNALDNEDPFIFCKKMGWLEQLYAMMAFDYLIINRDRHGANIEVIFRNDSVDLAPLFDHGLSFAYSCYDDEDRIRAFDSKLDRSVNNYLGTRSLEDNLSFITHKVLRNAHLDETIDSLFSGLEEALHPTLKEKIREIIELRWQHLIDLGIAEERDR